MAWFRTELRACRLCGRQVSNEAKACPACGHPLRGLMAIDRRWRLALAAAIFVAAAVAPAWPLLVELWAKPGARTKLWHYALSGFQGRLAARLHCQSGCVSGPDGATCMDRCFRDF